MSRKLRLTFMLTFVMLALFALPAVSLAHKTQSTSGTTRANFAFTGNITGTTTTLTGGLSLDIRSDGFFNGNFREPDGTQISVSGEIKKSSALTITFYDAAGKPFIKGQGTPTSAGKYTGPFQVFNGKTQTATGLWAATPVAPDKALTLAFNGTVVSGTDKGLNLAGAIILDSSTAKGYLLLPANGAQVPVSATLSNGGKNINVTFDLGTAEILGHGTLTENPANGLDKGYKGSFSGPAKDDQGQWTAFFFKF